MDREYVQAVIDVIEDGQKRGEFSRRSTRAPRRSLIGSLNWLTHWYHPDGELKGAEIADNFCDIFLVGLLSRASSEASGAKAQAARAG